MKRSGYRGESSEGGRESRVPDHLIGPRPFADLTSPPIESKYAPFVFLERQWICREGRIKIIEAR